MILRMAGPSLMSRDRHVLSRGLFVAGTITSYAAAKQQEEIRCPPPTSSSAPSSPMPKSAPLVQEFSG
ncbi:hypothetical protein [Bradyrhizobium sp. AZCC 2230]|uniref:hypothetical protein n=1 Tax=Bradyrhizobium sp. AZCC 2230 TaxID=3117021 RepID=UPI002FEF70D7